MNMAQIRISKTDEIEDILDFLTERYLGLSESEIVKLALAELYNRELQFAQLGAQAEDSEGEEVPEGRPAQTETGDSTAAGDSITEGGSISASSPSNDWAENESAQANPALKSVVKQEEQGLSSSSNPLTDPEEAAKEIPGVINIDEHR
jgi:hypothetical protein